MCRAVPFAHPAHSPNLLPCVRRRDERLRMRGELLAQQARRPSLDGSLVQNGRVRSGRVAVPGLADIGHP
jgi:hypothetical protein